MPSFDIVRELEASDSFRSRSIQSQFDLQTAKIREHFVGSIDIEGEWHIGAIVGRSGTGKSTIARELFPDAYVRDVEWTKPCLLDDFPPGLSTADITTALTSVGFASPPSWLKPYSVLSEGEKMRANLARALVMDNPLIVFDEFTSVVDRTVAKIASAAIQKAVRRANKRFIAVTCHFDVLEWLEPDWWFNTDDMTFHRGGDGPNGRCFRRPPIRLDIYRTDARYWPLFRKYHYLNHNVHIGAFHYLAVYEGRPVAYISTLYQPHAVNLRRKLGIRRVHRLVVLPDYQGVGIGTAVLNFVADLESRWGDIRFHIVTSNPGLAHSLDRSALWRHTGANKPARYGAAATTSKSLYGRVQRRATHTWEYRKIYKGAQPLESQVTT